MKTTNLSWALALTAILATPAFASELDEAPKAESILVRVNQETKETVSFQVAGDVGVIENDAQVKALIAALDEKNDRLNTININLDERSELDETTSTDSCYYYYWGRYWNPYRYAYYRWGGYSYRWGYTYNWGGYYWYWYRRY